MIDSIRQKYFRSELTYDQMSEYLIKHGWITHWHPDNWIRRSWQKIFKNIDWAGVDTEKAMEMQLRDDDQYS